MKCSASWLPNSLLTLSRRFLRAQRTTTRNYKTRVSSRYIVHTSVCLKTNLSSSISLKKVSRLVCSRPRRFTWKTTTVVCLRLLNLSTSLSTRSRSRATLPTRVPTGWLSRSTIKTSLCCLISPLRCRLSKTRPLLATRRNSRRRMSSWLTMACRASVYTLSSSCSRLTPCSTKTTNMSLWMAR